MAGRLLEKHVMICRTYKANSLRSFMLNCHISFLSHTYNAHTPIKVSMPSEARNVFVCLNIGIVSSSPTRSMDICTRFFFVLSCVGRGPATDRSSVKGVVLIVCKIYTFRLLLNGNRPRGLIRQKRRRKKKKTMATTIRLDAYMYTTHGDPRAVRT
jgi:hypothetical protein